MFGKKMIKGVIYDNPNIAEEEAYRVAESLSFEIDHFDEDSREVLAAVGHDFSGCPSRDEFFANIIIDSVIGRGEDYRNLVIPTTMIDNKLCEQLEKIDIGDKIIEEFIGLRTEIYRENHPVEFNPKKENFKVVFNGQELSQEEAVEFVEKLKNSLGLVG